MRNIEIKAKIDDPELIISRIKQLTDDKCVVIKQHDTFFKVPAGRRLKLRQFEDSTGELLSYERPNVLGPKLSDYLKASLAPENCLTVANILRESYGCVGIVKKVRKLYMIGQTRVHVDNVEGLGNFLELEVFLTDEQDAEFGEKIAQDLMAKLGIQSDDLIAEAYIDLLNKSAG
ncbi:Putative adenylate cyclase MJ0240 [Anthophora plagiata]